MEDQEPDYQIPDAEPEAAPARGPRRIKSVSKRGKRILTSRRQREEPREEVREAPRQASSHPDGVRLTRARKRTDDQFYIDKRIIPQGMDYNWKRESCFGQPDPYHMNGLRENHWSPVPDGRHAGLITKMRGMVLMERPKYLSDEAKQEDLREAIDQVQGVKTALGDTPGGTFPRDHPSAKATTRISREYTPLVISE